MFTIPSMTSTRQTKLTEAVTIANVERNHAQIASIAAPTVVVRLSPPYGRGFDDAGDSDDLGLTIDLCDTHQVGYFAQLEKEIERATRKAFGDTLQIKPLVRDGYARLKIKKDVDCIDAEHKQISVLSISPGDFVVPIVRVSCLWKSDVAVGASVRVIRLMVVQRATPEIPNFIEEEV